MIILASQSAARRAMLTAAGVAHEAVSPMVDEDAAKAALGHLGGRDLADAVRRGKSGAPEIDVALTRLNAAQAALQRATLAHFFAMKDHLEPAQAEKLLQWTHDSILPR